MPVSQKALEQLVRLLAGTVIGLSVVALIGWASASSTMKTAAMGPTAMNPTTAAAFIFSALSLLLLKHPALVRARIGRALGAVVGLLGLFVLADYALGTRRGIDLLLFQSELEGNRMAPNTAIGFLLAGIALATGGKKDSRPISQEPVLRMLHKSRVRHWFFRVRQGLSPAGPAVAIIAVTAFMYLVAYAFDAESVYGFGKAIPMAASTVIAFEALALGLMCARPEQGIVAVVMSPNAGGVAARRLLPAAAVLPLIFGWVRIQGQHAGYISTELGAAFMVATTVGLFVAAVRWTSSTLNRMDHQRQQAEHQLRCAYRDLEDRVSLRTSELAALNCQLQCEVVERGLAESEVQRLADTLCTQLEQLATANQDLEQKNQENETFVYSVSHDLRSPLVNLQGFSKELSTACQELRDIVVDSDLSDTTKSKVTGLVDDDMETSIHFIQTAVSRLGVIIDSLLRLSRAGRLELQFQQVDVRLIVERVVTSMAVTIHDRGAEIMIGDLPKAWGDPSAIEQIFANLIGNALNYSDPSRACRIEIDASADPVNSGRKSFHVYHVRDNGLGIPSAQLKKVFHAFKRFHPEAASGEGMGLAIVSRMAERHGGKVTVSSEVNQGSIFSVVLPAVVGSTQVASTVVPSFERSVQNE